MKTAIFNTHSFDRECLTLENEKFHHELTFLPAALSAQTAPLAKGFPAISCFVSDKLDVTTLPILRDLGVKLIALRSAGYNHVDLVEARNCKIRVVRVPAYSPHAIAEHAVALLLSLDRKIPKAFNRVRDLNFTLDGLMGFDLFGKTVGVIGTGRIGSILAKILKGFGCEVLAYDPYPDPKLVSSSTAVYVDLSSLFKRSDIISLHCPLTPKSLHLINADAIASMKQGVFLINTGRGGLIDTQSLIHGLKSGKIGGAALDVYEEEEGIFYENLSEQGVDDDALLRLLAFPNVLITSHQGFFTREAVTNIAHTTLKNIADFEAGRSLENEVKSGL